MWLGTLTRVVRSSAAGVAAMRALSSLNSAPAAATPPRAAGGSSGMAVWARSSSSVIWLVRVDFRASSSGASKYARPSARLSSPRSVSYTHLTLPTIYSV